jgi:hypothetical protein
MDATWPLPPAPVAVAVDGEPHANPRLLGLVIGAAVPALVASVAWWVDVDFVAIIAAAGIPIGAILGAWLGRRWLDSAWIGFALLAGIAAPLMAVAVLSAVFLVTGSGSNVDGGTQALSSWFVVSLLAAVYGEVFGTPITVPTALVAGFLVRRAARMPIRRAAMHVGLLVVATIALGAVTLLAYAGLLAPLGVARGIPGF